jgi:hypothetical protein
MGKTTEVAADRAFDQTKTVLPAEVARGVHMQNVPSLRALKLMHLMIGTAAGAWRNLCVMKYVFQISVKLTAWRTTIELA